MIARRVTKEAIYPLDRYAHYEGFPKWLRNTRRALGLSQSELAAALRVTPKQVNRWENGHVFPAFQNLQSICKFLDIPPNRIFKEVVAEREKKYEGAIHRVCTKGRLYELPPIRCIPKT
jgi:transcriptional regulator with XRE-family HTH domain